MKQVRKIIELIGGLYPEGAFPGRDEENEPEWNTDPFHVLISTVLSQRTKDENTFVASKRLFSRYNDPSRLARAPLAEIRKLIRPAGFPTAKSKAIREIAMIVHEEYGDEVPADMEKLLALPLVGRKTANCVLVYGFGLDAIPVDTHVHRVSNRIGLAKTARPEDTETALVKVIPRDLWRTVNTLFVAFGKNVCTPRNPKCGICPVKTHCNYYRKVYLVSRPVRGK